MRARGSKVVAASCTPTGTPGFNGLYEPDPATGDTRLTEVACWAHGRRKLFEVHAATGSATA